MSGLFGTVAFAVSACGTTPATPLLLEPQVDLRRFMGDWYVIAAIPTRFEKNAYNPMDHYVLDQDGSVATSYTFNDGGFDGKAKEYHSRGYVLSPDHAVWGMQYIWPFKADYRISYVSKDYTQTVITREKRDYVWIMARTPQISEVDYRQLVELVRDQGYDTNRLQKAPQK